MRKIPSKSKRKNADLIVNTIISKEGVTLGELKNKKTRKIADIICILTGLLQKYTNLDTMEIGEILNRDHSTIVEASWKVKNPFLFSLQQKYKEYDSYIESSSERIYLDRKWIVKFLGN